MLKELFEIKYIIKIKSGNQSKLTFGRYTIHKYTKNNKRRIDGLMNKHWTEINQNKFRTKLTLKKCPPPSPRSPQKHIFFIHEEGERL